MTKAPQTVTDIAPNTPPTCFVIMPISNQPGYDPDHFTLVYQDIIKPAIELANMIPVRADETKNTNLIQLDILKNVIASDIAICDMSAKNPNVFYELGVRQAFDKPTVLMIDDSTGAPFDVSSLRYVNYSKGMKYRDVKVAIAKLAETLKDTYAKRADKNEINSLIRLLELTSPAQLGQADLSAEAKANLLNELQYSEIMNAIQRIQQEQTMLLNEIKYPAPSNFDREYNNIIETNKIKVTKRDIDEYFKRTLKNNNESFIKESKNT